MAHISRYILQSMAIYILFEKTFLGSIMQATAQDRYVADLIDGPTSLPLPPST